ncbi:Adenylate cyclase type 9 [Clonorchis sinensis]|uniref:adenylate cyclase n=1 Tax=Clonorchis sinensis TaxID=79923 RepID=A0A3R7CUP8_CLOSI|nr:Adenylate cyclase type 9 [Clonorchis sinensis]
MRAWYRGWKTFEQSAIHAHLLTDLFEGNRTGFAVLRIYFNVLRRLLKSMEVQSSFLTDYFNQLWLYRTKRQFRVALKFFISSCVFLVLEPGLLCPIDKHATNYYLYLLFGFYIFIYLATFRTWTHTVYTYMGLVTGIINLSIHFVLRCYSVAGNHVPVSLLFTGILAIFVVLPICLELVLSLTLLYFVILGQLNQVYGRSSRLRNTSSVASPLRVEDFPKWFMFDLSRVIHMYRFDVNRSNKVFYMRCFVWGLAIFIGLYARFWNTLRKRFAFLKLGTSVQARCQTSRAHEGSSHWIETIMPKHVSAEYQRLRRLHEHHDVSDWFYMQTFDCISIMFADIVGFTNMSSKLTALQIVVILGDLIKQFDEVCEATRCEKLGTLGDCYYCMAGGQDPNQPHAMCCIEMGLGMCDILRRFNEESQQSVNMRVGIHTGIGHAAILGCDRFRYDVYSYDVRIANELESTGRPGFIHISQSTYEEVKNMYVAVPGPDLVVDKREHSFLLERTAAKVNIPTYFIAARETRLSKASSVYEKYPHSRRRTHRQVASEQSEPSALNWSSLSSTETSDHSSSSSESDILDPGVEWLEFELSPEALADIKLSHQTSAMHLRRDIELIQDLRTDPAKQHLLFQAPPLDSVLLRFLNMEIEWHYQTEKRFHIGPTFVDSEKLAQVMDAFVFFIINIIMSAFGMFFVPKFRLALLYLITFGISCFLLFTAIFTGTTYPDRIKSKWLRKYYQLCTRQIVYELLTGLFTCLPTLIILIYHHTFFHLESPEIRMWCLSSSTLVAMIVHCIPSSSASWARCTCCVFSYFVLLIHQFVHIAETQDLPLCLHRTILFNGLPLDRWSYVQQFEQFLCFFLVMQLTRETERICKLCFFVHREAQIESEAAEKAMSEANELLFNIVPAYVFEELREGGKDDLFSQQATLHYAVAHPMVGVAFVSVANFFSQIYREDLGGAERSLHLLHTIICTFDKLLKHPDAKHVEKIKSMNENYMVASGLNRKEIGQNVDKMRHLCTLMTYCFMLRKALFEIRVYDRKEMGFLRAKIGYNIGPVTAGIIGTTKLHYDIWGDTVNVASRMCYTGVPGPIQVSEDVKNMLKDRFQFVYRGEFFVKGKGMMRTYICEEKKT